MLVFDFLDAAYTGTYDDADTKNIFLREIDPAVIDRLARRGHGELSEAVHSLAFSPVDVLSYVEALYLAPEADRVRTRIERFYGGNAAPAFAQRREKLIRGLR
jgi:hypothetical protein